MALSPQEIERLRQKYGVQSQQKDQTAQEIVDRLRREEKQAGEQQFEKMAAQVGISPAPSELGFFSRVKERLIERADKFGEAKRLEGGVARKTLRAVGQGAGLVGDVTFEGLRSVAKGVSKVTPDFIEEPIKEKTTQAGLAVLQSPIGQAGLRAIQEGMESYQEWKKRNPAMASDLESVVNIASLLPIGKGAQITGRGTMLAKEAVGEAAGVAAKGLEKNIAKKSIQDALEVIKPKLTKKQVEATLKAGRGEVSGLLRKVDVKPTTKELKIAEAVAGVVDKNASDIKNINNILQKIGAIAEETRKGLTTKKGLPKAIFNQATVKSYLNNAKESSRILFGTDKTIEKAYDAVTDEFMRLLKSKPKTLEGVLDARQQFDNVIERKFPGLLSNPAGDVVRRNAVLDVRRAANEFVSDMLPEGNLFKKQLKQQTLMYDAIENIAGKAAGTVDTNILQRAVKALSRHPLATLGGGVGLGVGAASGVLSSPLLIAAILAGGTYKVGKTIIDSTSLRKMLQKGLELIERGLKTSDEATKARLLADKKAVSEVLEKIRKTPVGLQLEDVSRVGKEGAEQAPRFLDDTLLNEARKYKSAEEFVKAQGKEVYHATDSEPFDVFDIGKAKKGETYFNPLGTGQYLSSNKEFVKRFGANTINYVLPKNAKIKVVTLDSWANKDYPVIVKRTLKKLGIDYNDLDLDEKVLLNRQVPDSPIMSLNNAKVIIGDIAERFGKKGDVQKLIEQVSDSRNANYDAIIFRSTDSALKADEILIPKPSKIKTKSQLEDIWKQANKATPETSLLAEARKYKSAEEFVKAHNKISEDHIRKYTHKAGIGTYNNEELSNIVKNAKKSIKNLPDYEGVIYRGRTEIEPLFNLKRGDTIDVLDLQSATKSREVAKDFVYGKSNKQVYEIKTRNGKDITEFSARPEEKEVVLLGGKLKFEKSRFVGSGRNEYELLTFSHIPEVVTPKTKSQLEDIWRQANK